MTFRAGTVPEDEEEGGRAWGEMINNQLLEVTRRAGWLAGITSFSAPTSCRVLLRRAGGLAGWWVDMDHILGQLLCYLTLPQDIPCGGSYSRLQGDNITLDCTGLGWAGTQLFFF